jgi:mono/diheme cytochrome c family protein
VSDTRRRGRAAAWLLAATFVLHAGAATRAAEDDGGYRRRCAPCHGATGRGDGPHAEAFDPRPADLRAGVLDRHDVDALVRHILDGKAVSLDLDLARLRARSNDVEALVTHLHRLPGIDWRLVDRGEDLYIRHCERCHGRFGRPGPTPPPGVGPPRDLSEPDFQAGMSDIALMDRVRHGRRGMPAIPPLRDAAQLRAVVAYVRLLSPGLALYDRYCASCHGADGRGDQVIEPWLAPRVVFDQAYFVRTDPEALRTRVWHMLSEHKPAMPHFRGRLDEKSARAIVDYLKRTP